MKKPQRVASYLTMVLMLSQSGFGTETRAHDLQGCDKKAVEIPKIAVAHFVPWSNLNQNIQQSQARYDMPIMKASGDIVQNCRREMIQAQSFGIDAFAQDIATNLNYAFSETFASSLSAAEGTSFKVFPMMGGISDKRLDGIPKLMEQSGKHPNWLRIDGRPVFCTFWAGNFGDSDMYNRVRQLLEEQGFDFFMIGDPDCDFSKAPSAKVLDAYKGCFDMLFTFSELGRGGMNPASAYRILADAAPTVARSHTFVAGIAPGYLGGWHNGRNDYYVPYRGFDQYLDSWEGALAANAGWVYLTTWNDRDETHLQPTLFQWDSALEISSYYIHLWKHGQPPEKEPQFFCAYPREQLLGTLQRIELICLPGSKGVQAEVSGKLYANDGRILGSLPSRKVEGRNVVRVDWAVDTLECSSSPVVRPVLQIVQGKLKKQVTLPAFVMRSGWIANHSLIKAPLAKMASGSCTLQIDSPSEYEIRAKATINGGETIKSAELFCNDRRLTSFDPSHLKNPRVQILLTSKIDKSIHVSVADGEILRALRDISSAESYLKYDKSSLSTQVGSSAATAFEVEATPQTKISFIGKIKDKEETITLTVSEIVKGQHLLFDGQVTVGLPAFDAMTDLAKEFTPDTISVELAAHTDKHRLRDGYYVRIETNSGKTMESPWIYPGLVQGAASKPTFVISTPYAFDARNLKDYIDQPPNHDVCVKTALTYPAILQSSEWGFDDEKQCGIDAAERNNLTLGRGDSYLGVDPARIPKWMAGSGINGTGCLWFDGEKSRAQIPVQQEPKGPFDISFDIYPEEGTSGERNILSGFDAKDAAFVSSGISITRLADGTVQAGRISACSVKSPEPIPANQWSKIRVRFSGDHLWLFVNGQAVAESHCAPDFKRFGNSRLYLGGPEKPFKGRLDNMRIDGYDYTE